MRVAMLCRQRNIESIKRKHKNSFDTALINLFNVYEHNCLKINYQNQYFHWCGCGKCGGGDNGDFLKLLNNLLIDYDHECVKNNGQWCRYYYCKDKKNCDECILF